MLVLPGGISVNDISCLPEGNYKNGRRMIVFKDLEEIGLREVLLQEVIKQWLQLVEEVG